MNIQQSWGANPPRFIQLLNAEASATDNTAAAKRIGISRTAVSLLLCNRYPSPSFEKVEAKVMAALDKVHCPVLGALENSECQKQRNTPFSSANPQRVNLYRACQQCSNNPNRQETAS